MPTSTKRKFNTNVLDERIDVRLTKRELLLYCRFLGQSTYDVWEGFEPVLGDGSDTDFVNEHWAELHDLIEEEGLIDIYMQLPHFSIVDIERQDQNQDAA